MFELRKLQILVQWHRVMQSSNDMRTRSLATVEIARDGQGHVRSSVVVPVNVAYMSQQKRHNTSFRTMASIC